MYWKLIPGGGGRSLDLRRKKYDKNIARDDKSAAQDTI